MNPAEEAQPADPVRDAWQALGRQVERLDPAHREYLLWVVGKILDCYPPGTATAVALLHADDSETATLVRPNVSDDDVRDLGILLSDLDPLAVTAVVH